MGTKVNKCLYFGISMPEHSKGGMNASVPAAKFLQVRNHTLLDHRPILGPYFTPLWTEVRAA